MTEIRLENYQALWLLWCLPLLVGIYIYAFARKRRALRLFADAPTLSRINLNVSRKKQITKTTHLLLAFATIIILFLVPCLYLALEDVQGLTRFEKSEPAATDQIVGVQESRLPS